METLSFTSWSSGLKTHTGLHVAFRFMWNGTTAFLRPQFEDDKLPGFMASIIMSQSLVMNLLLSVSY